MENVPIRRKKADVVYLTYPSLEDTGLVVHGFSTRLGGVSTGDCASMNLSFQREESKENVMENYRRIADAIGFSVESVVCSDQIHTTNVRLVTREDCGSGITREKIFFDVDGMITQDTDVTLATFFADCVPLFFVDTKKKAIGLSHSGWRGTVGRMGLQTVLAMEKEFGSNPKDITAVIGPSICMECYEVGSEVADEFKKEFSNHSDILRQTSPEKYQLDLWKANYYVLEEAGIPQENISMPGICTCCNPKLLFSHRATKGKRGNLAAFLKLKK